MKLILVCQILFLAISIAGFLGALFFGPTGAAIVMIMGLSLSFIGIAVSIGG